MELTNEGSLLVDRLDFYKVEVNRIFFGNIQNELIIIRFLT